METNVQKDITATLTLDLEELKTLNNICRAAMENCYNKLPDGATMAVEDIVYGVHNLFLEATQ